MSAMKTSSPTPPLIRFPSSTSSLKDFFYMTRQKVTSVIEGRWSGRALSSKRISQQQFQSSISTILFNLPLDLSGRWLLSPPYRYGNRLRDDEKGLKVAR